MKPIKILLVSALALGASCLSHAGSQPKFTIVATSPTTLTIGDTQTVVVSYKVTNQTKVARTLTIKSTNGVTQIIPGSSSCSSPFLLGYNQSCELSLRVNGAVLGAGARVSGGPVVCKTQTGTNTPDPFLCSQPSLTDSLNILVTKDIPPTPPTPPPPPPIVTPLTGSWVNISSTVPGVNIPGMGVKALATLTSNPSVVYAAMNSFYVSKSMDGGQTWAVVNSQSLINSSQGWDIQINPVNPNILYFAGSGGVFKSIDAGVTWGLSSTGLPGTTILAITLDPNNPNIVYAGTAGSGVYKSSNAGATWTALNGGVLNDKTIYSITIQHNDSNIILLGGSSLLPSESPGDSRPVYKSIDGGLNWTAADNGLPSPPNRRTYDITIDPVNTQVYYAAMRSGGTPAGGGVYKTIDGGSTWNVVPGIPTVSDSYVVRINPADSAMLVAGTASGVYKSINSGTSWTPANAGFAPIPTAYALQWPVSNLLVLGNLVANTQIYRSTNQAVNWQAGGAITTLASQEVLSLLLTDSNTLLASFYGTLGLFRTISHGTAWEDLNNPNLLSPTAFCMIHAPNDPNTIYTAVDGLGVLKTTDGGLSWVEKNTGLFPDFNFQDIAIAATNPNILYVSNFSTPNGGVYQSINGGDSWQLLPFFAAKAGNSLMVDRSNPAIVYVGQSNGFIYKTTDSGATWTTILVVPATSISLSQSPFDSRVIYAVARDGVHKSADAGATWISLNNGLPMNAAPTFNTGVLVSTDTPERLFVGFQGANAGVYQSVNGGLNWTSLNTGLPTNLYTLINDPSDPRKLYASTSIYGVYEFIAN